MKVYSFPRGGIFFTDPSAPSRASTEIAFLPGISVIPLTQHPAGPAAPTVSVGDRVREGMLVGRAGKEPSANVHATVPGKVIRMVSWESTDGLVNEAMVIRMEGSFEMLGKQEIPYPWKDLSPFELRRLISDYGIVEMEGEGKPVADLLLDQLGKKDAPISTLVIRCVFDDPWLAADKALCRERLKAVVEGSLIASQAGGLKRLLFAVSRDESRLGEEFLMEAERADFPASLALVGDRYPQRNRRELELVLRDYEKREGLVLGGFLILGPATLAAIRDAVVLRKPVLDRYVAVGGSAVKNPQVMRVRLGTRIGELFAECGGFVGKPTRIATGSPFQGRPVVELDEPVTKTSYAVFALMEREARAGSGRICISCGECRAVCPVGFDPEELYKQTRMETGTASHKPSTPADPALPVCHGCGCCELVCPSRLPLSAALTGLTGRVGNGD
jgi:electron transport complex protein RnfC